MSDNSAGKERNFEEEFYSVFDKAHGGFGEGEKFPPFASMLFMMALYEEEGSERLREIVLSTLNGVLSGLKDAENGGFYRFANGRAWTDPVPEKALFDQGMHLWVFSVAYKIFGLESYKEAANELVEFLKEEHLDDHLLKVDDGMKVTSWNAVSGVGLVMASRYCGNEEALGIAERIFAKLMTDHVEGGKIVHSAFGGIVHGEDELEDFAAVLVLATYLYENSFDGKDLVESLAGKVASMKEGLEFGYDVPMLSALSLAEFGLLRAGKILEKSEYGKQSDGYVPVLESDLHNLCVFLARGALHDIHVKERIDWSNLPVNVLQMPGTMYIDCYGNMCRMYKSEDELISALKK